MGGGRGLGMSSKQKLPFDNRMTLEDFRADPDLRGLWQPHRTGKNKVKTRKLGIGMTRGKPCVHQIQETKMRDDQVLSFELPWPPSVNNMHRHTSRGTFLAPHTKDYHKTIAQLIAINRMVGMIGGALVDVALVLHEPDNGSIHDCDNYSKVLFDSLSRANFWHDDKQVKRTVVAMGSRCEGGAIEFAVRLHRRVVSLSARSLLE